MTQNNLPITFSNLINTWINDAPEFSTTADWTITWPNSFTYPKNIEDELNKFTDIWSLIRKNEIVVDGSNLPKTNIHEDDKGLHIECSIPFVNKDDVKIITDSSLGSIKVEINKHQDDKNYVLKEISRTSFKRTIIVPKKFDLNRALANINDGILSIDVPFSKDVSERTLQIK